MKKIALIISLLFGLNAFTQAQTLTNIKWKVAESGIADDAGYGLPGNSSRPVYVFFHKDSTNNSVDFSNIEFEFFDDSTYQGKNQLGNVYNGTWLLNATADSLTIDTVTSRFDFIDASNLITKTSTEQVVDTLGTVDTVYSYVKLTIKNTVQVQAYGLGSGIRVFPVPASDYVYIDAQLPGKKAKEINVYNVFGQLVQNTVLENKACLPRLDTQQLAAGYYFIEAKDAAGSRIGIARMIKSE